MNTYKQEFNVANWSEIEKKVKFKTQIFQRGSFSGLVHKNFFASKFLTDFTTLAEFLEENKIDFINFDK